MINESQKQVCEKMSFGICFRCLNDFELVFENIEILYFCFVGIVDDFEMFEIGRDFHFFDMFCHFC